MSGYITKKKDMRFQSVEALQQVVNVVNEAAAALDDPKRTIRESAIPEVLAGAFGAGIGGAASFAALYGLGTVGLSAAGITSGLATAGAVVGGGMVAGVFVLAAPVALLAAGGVGLTAHLKSKQLRQEKERLYQGAQKASGDYKSAKSGAECQQGTPGVFGKFEYFAEPGHSRFETRPGLCDLTRAKAGVQQWGAINIRQAKKTSIRC